MNRIYLLILVVIKLIIAQDYDYEKSANNALRISSHYATNTVSKSATPVPILKQINRHNEDGSYTYGYEGADGSFKIETKSPAGEVKGKYGYYDQGGKLRVVEYGADKHGFQPSGEGITVAPPTLVDETTNKDSGQSNDDDQITKVYYHRAQPRPLLQHQPQRQPPQPQQHQQQQPAQIYYQQYITSPRTIQAQAPQYVLPPQLSPAPQQFPPAPSAAVNYQTQPARAQYQPSPLPQKPLEVAPYDQLAQYLKSVTLKAEQQQQHAQQQQPQPQQYYQQVPSAPQYYQKPRPEYGILDRLVKDYALPANNVAAPLHDISFGFY